MRFGYRAFLTLSSLVLVFREDAFSEDPTTSGHLKMQAGVASLNSDGALAALGPDDPWQGSFEARANLEKQVENLQLFLHAEFLGIGGDGLKARRAVSAGRARNLLPSDRYRAMDLSIDLDESQDFESLIRLDRFGIGYSTDLFAAKIGRQAVSWGNGLGFQVFDFFSPFSPIAIDKDYKPGEDMLFGQIQLSGGDDIQLAITPRRERESHDFEMEQSSGAVKYRGQIENVTYEVLSGSRLNNFVAGAGASKNLWEGVLRSDLLYTERSSSKNTVDFLLNYDRSWEIAEKNVYTFVEYFYNGLGADDIDLLNIDAELQKQVLLGESYVLGKEYVNTGLRIELTPLVNLYPSTVVNLHDGTGVVQMRLVYDVLQDVALTLGGNLPYGSDGEFDRLEKEVYIRFSLWSAGFRGQF